MKMKDKMLDAVRCHAEGQVAKHKMNVDVYLTNPAGIGEHSCVIESVTHELKELGGKVKLEQDTVNSTQTGAMQNNGLY